MPSGQEVVSSGGSYFNEQEASVVAELVNILLAAGLEASEVGVITLYKAQMYKVTQLLSAQG